MKKAFQIEKGYYREISNVNIEIDDSIKWVQDYTITNVGLHKNFCNYWTVVDEEIYNKYFSFKTFSCFEHIKWVDKHIICINDVKPNENFSLIKSPDEFLNKLDLKNTIIMVFDEDYNVNSISKVRNFKHPYYAEIDKFMFFPSGKVCVYQIKDTLHQYAGLQKSVIITDDKHIWKNCVWYMINNISDEECMCMMKWRHNQTPPKLNKLKEKLISKIGEEPVFDMDEIVSSDIINEYKKYFDEIDSLLSQFGLTIKDFD